MTFREYTYTSIVYYDPKMSVSELSEIFIRLVRELTQGMDTPNHTGLYRIIMITENRIAIQGAHTQCN